MSKSNRIHPLAFVFTAVLVTTTTGCRERQTPQKQAVPKSVSAKLAAADPGVTLIARSVTNETTAVIPRDETAHNLRALITPPQGKTIHLRGKSASGQFVDLAIDKYPALTVRVTQNRVIISAKADTTPLLSLSRPIVLTLEDADRTTPSEDIRSLSVAHGKIAKTLSQDAFRKLIHKHPRQGLAITALLQPKPGQGPITGVVAKSHRGDKLVLTGALLDKAHLTINQRGLFRLKILDRSGKKDRHPGLRDVASVEVSQ